ncbi:hypothetical protein FQN50_000942, partial [Emmonsiellopsis sp. PD_5]
PDPYRTGNPIFLKLILVGDDNLMRDSLLDDDEEVVDVEDLDRLIDDVGETAGGMPSVAVAASWAARMSSSRASASVEMYCGSGLRSSVNLEPARGGMAG